MRSSLLLVKDSSLRTQLAADPRCLRRYAFGSASRFAPDVEASPARIVEILSTTEGHRGFWTEDCEVSTDRARFGFPSTPIDLEVDVTVEPTKVVRMRVTSGFPFWEGSTWEWELGDAVRAETGTVSYSGTTVSATAIQRPTLVIPRRPGRASWTGLPSTPPRAPHSRSSRPMRPHDAG
jgi:hypothetical protein